ncbi:MAG: hypothetical protein FWD84_06870, partial [Oscillospiraceae bacterium]|nr:hypothetical protein [Oscillospiraceae bacterium]
IFAEALDSANVDEDSFVLVNNTRRYRFTALIDVVRSFGQRSMYQTGFRLPPWENAARMAEDFAALTLVLILLLLIYPTVEGICFLVRRFRRRTWRLGMAKKRFEDIREKRRAAEWQNTRDDSGARDKELDVDEIIKEVRESEGVQ